MGLSHALPPPPETRPTTWAERGQAEVEGRRRAQAAGKPVIHYRGRSAAGAWCCDEQHLTWGKADDCAYAQGEASGVRFDVHRIYPDGTVVRV